MFSDQLREKLQTERQSMAFSTYQRVRDRVLEMLDKQAEQDSAPSLYWQEEVEGFDYMLDATPLLVAKLREHCYHITGIRSYEYRHHHAHAAEPFRRKVAALQAIDPDNLFVPESPALGGFGHQTDLGLVNIDTLKFYESAIALARAGFLPRLRSQRSIVVEIGAGWGGFGYYLKTLVPDLTYIIVDLPQTILFSATYLMSVFPDAKVYLHGETPAAELRNNAKSFDFVFIPHYDFDKVALPPLDLGINMVSFQEMTTSQVDGYFTRLKQLGCSRFYSHNRDRSAHNTELSAVGTIMKKHYEITELDLLPLQYTQLVPRTVPQQGFRLSSLMRSRQFLIELARFYVRSKPKARRGKGLHDYRHLAGTL